MRIPPLQSPSGLYLVSHWKLPAESCLCQSLGVAVVSSSASQFFSWPLRNLHQPEKVSIPELPRRVERGKTAIENRVVPAIGLSKGSSGGNDRIEPGVSRLGASVPVRYKRWRIRLRAPRLKFFDLAAYHPAFEVASA
ncbi:hypothetical protein R1flu_011253 [Riccia fluitans]|uniref:Uncharacterized protein n=1 Tax=Riccia fluitans TaxID=41844 RepID=A0ABD1Z7N4_9MARC